MSKHFRQPEPAEAQQFECEPVESVWGDAREGELDGYGVCMTCGTNWFACPGVYYCQYCTDDF